MIHYHGTPLSGSASEKGKFLIGRHALVPFTYQDDMEAVAEFAQSFILDNGAFTIWKQGGSLDIDAYFEFVDRWHKHPGFDWALIPDVIDGNEIQNDSMIDIWPREFDGVPVWHLHESLERLAHLASEYRTIALGSSGRWSTPGAFGWWGRMKEIMDTICIDGRPTCRIHGLRMLDPDIFTHLPLASADSTNAAVNAGSLGRFGIYKPASAAQRAEVIADRIESYNSSPIWNGYQQKEFDLVHTFPAD